MSFLSSNRTYILQLRRTVRIPIDRLYSSLTDAERRSQWFSEMSHIEPVVGGMFTSDNGLIGKFEQVIPHEKWKLDWLNPNHKTGSKVVLEFLKNGRFESTLVIRHWKIKSKKDYEELYRGWLWILDSLESYVEKGSPINYHQWIEKNMVQT